MAILLDTSILVRLANASDPQHADAARAVVELHRRGEVLSITPQVMIEFRSVATRPKSVNGAGLSAAEAESHAITFEGKFSLLADGPDIYSRWKTLVDSLGIIGKQVHDARLVAVCQVHAVAGILSFNVSHFARMAGANPAIRVIDPACV